MGGREGERERERENGMHVVKLLYSCNYILYYC